MKIFSVNKKGLKEIARQWARLTGKKIGRNADLWGFFSDEVNNLEEQAARGSTIGCEVGARHTLSKHPEFIQLEAEHFDVKEIED